MADPKAPSEGFKTGGWYEGRQYWGGTFSEPGQIHPSSNQPGAGQTVSKEVVQQTDPANWGYIQQQRQAQGLPKAQEEVTPYLNDFQDTLLKESGAPEVRIPTMEELKSELSPSIAYPGALDRVGKFEELRASYGVSDLEKQLTDLKGQEDDLYAEFREQRFTEKGKPVPLGVIEGRISEEERQYLERTDYLGRQVARITDELNTKYGIISTMMNLMGLDYQDAVGRYETEFNQNLQMYNIILGQEKEARSAYEADRAAASANLTMFYNAITSGNVNYSSLGADQKIMINKLEAQAGLPVGFMATIKMDADANILFTTSNEGITQVGIRNADGTISVESHGTRISSTGSVSDTKNIRRQFNEASVGSNFPDLVNKFASSMSLEEIYNAYANTDRGRDYGKPIENSQEIKLLYKVARGEMTPEEARAELEGY